MLKFLQHLKKTRRILESLFPEIWLVFWEHWSKMDLKWVIAKFFNVVTNAYNLSHIWWKDSTPKIFVNNAKHKTY